MAGSVQEADEAESKSKERKRETREALVNAIIRAVQERENHRAVGQTSCFME